ALREDVVSTLRARMEHLAAWRGRTTEGPEDGTWYAAAPAMLDHLEYPNDVEIWTRENWRASHESQEDDERSDQGVESQHLEQFARYFTNPPSMGRPPEDLFDVLADMAIGGPAVVAARALRRVRPHLAKEDANLLTASSRIALGFM